MERKEMEENGERYELLTVPLFYTNTLSHTHTQTHHNTDTDTYTYTHAHTRTTHLHKGSEERI